MGTAKKVKEQRHFIRHPMCFPLRYTVVVKKGKDNKEKKASTINISRGGLLFSARRSVDAGAVIVIKIPFQSKIFKVKAKVVHCEKLSEISLYEIGVRFLRYNEAFKVKLIEQMYLISEYRDLNSIRLGRDLTMQEASKEWVKRYSKRFQRLYW